MRKVWSVSLSVAALAVLSSCSAIDAIGSAGRMRGTFELRAVNGSRIPATIYSEPGYRVEVLNANFTLENDGTYTEAGIIRETVNGSSSTSSSSSYGRFDSYGDEITFTESNGRRYYGRMQGYTLIVEDQGVTLEYVRY